MKSLVLESNQGLAKKKIKHDYLIECRIKVDLEQCRTSSETKVREKPQQSRGHKTDFEK